MADFEQALTKTENAEGQFFFNRKTGEIVNRGITISTLIALHLLPADILTAYQAYKSDGNYGHLDSVFAYMKSRTPEEDAEFYQANYWNEIRGDDILDQALANKVFDIAVNQGLGSSVRLLQQAVNDLQLGGAQLTVDGEIGPHTLAAVNALPASSLLTQFKSLVEARYRQIAASNPALAGDLEGWLARLNS